MKKLAFALGALALYAIGCVALAGAADLTTNSKAATETTSKAVAAAGRNPLSTANCSFTFTLDTHTSSMRYCVTANGNIVQLEFPINVQQVSPASRAEGYGICDFDANVSYFDYAGAGATANWGPTSVLSQTTKSLKFSRTTTDGIWTLTQTIAEVTGVSPAAKITMAVRNNSNVRKSFSLLRYADMDVDGVATNNFDATQKSALAWISDSSPSSGVPFGVVLQNVGQPSTFFSAFAQNTPRAPDPCNVNANTISNLQTSIDGSLMMVYFFDVGPLNTGTATVTYKGW